MVMNLHRFNWRIGISQTIAVKSYAMAFLALQTSQSNLGLSEEAALEAFHRKLSEELEDVKNQTYQAFLSDASVPDDERALLAEEFAHLVEEIKASVIPPWIDT